MDIEYNTRDEYTATVTFFSKECCKVVFSILVLEIMESNLIGHCPRPLYYDYNVPKTPNILKGIVC